MLMRVGKICWVENVGPWKPACAGFCEGKFLRCFASHIYITTFPTGFSTEKAGLSPAFIHIFSIYYLVRVVRQIRDAEKKICEVYRAYIEQIFFDSNEEVPTNRTSV
jgi:hypothetical protein